MEEKVKQWINQANYDLDTAEYMFNGGRYFYTVFMCHLSIEKALKGLYYKIFKEAPPKTHNLISLVNNIKIKPPEQTAKFIVKINSASIVTRYPENLEEIKKQYTKEIVKNILDKSKETIKWIKKQF